MKSEYISWRYVLRCFNELKEDDWILPEEFSNLFSVPRPVVAMHFKKLKKFSLVRTQPAKDMRSIRGGNHNRYQITPSGKSKIEYWEKLKNRKCPNCGFNVNIREF